MNQDDQIKEISNLLLEYSSGNYDYQGNISDEVNELDMIISGINMLGEELVSTNVSRDYFSSIFNAVTDLVMIVDENGVLTDVNQASIDALTDSTTSLKGSKLDSFLTHKGIFKQIKTSLQSENDHIVIEEELNGKDDNIIFGLFTCSKILDRFDHFKGYLISIKDITEQKENEKLILKTIFTTQQIEQKRVADDLHDSLGQELSMAKLMISNLKAMTEGNKRQTELIETCTDILDNSIQHLREICFNLMPSVLLRGGLDLAIQDLLKKLEHHEALKVEYNTNAAIERMDSDLEVVLYRIVQEFINNMIKHANATLLTIDIFVDSYQQTITLQLTDNGVGFNIKRLSKIGENRGYQNLQSKVKAFNGELEIFSEIDKGTMTKVKFPIIPSNEQN